MEEFLATPFTEPYYFALLTATIFGIVFLRYLLVSGLYHYALLVGLRQWFGQRILNETIPFSTQQAWQEIV